MSIRLSIVIPTHERNDGLLCLLSDLERQDLPKDTYEVLVVSNLPDLELEATLQNRHARYFCSGIKGVNRARNCGLKNSLGEFVYFLDDDCRIPNVSHLTFLLERFKERPNATAIGGPYAPANNMRAWEFAYWTRANKWLVKSVYDGERTINLIGGNVAYRKDLLKGQMFDDQIVFGGSETEFHARLIASGCDFHFFQNFPVTHEIRMTIRQFCKKAFMQGKTQKRMVEAGLLHPDSALGYLINQTERERSIWSLLYDLFFQLGAKHKSSFNFEIRKDLTFQTILALTEHALRYLWIYSMRSRGFLRMILGLLHGLFSRIRPIDGFKKFHSYLISFRFIRRVFYPQIDLYDRSNGLK